MMCYINVCFAGVYGVFEEKCGLCDHVHLFSTGGLFLSIELSVLIPESSRIYHARPEVQFPLNKIHFKIVQCNSHIYQTMAFLSFIFLQCDW